MSLLVVLALIALALAVLVALPSDLVDQGDGPEAEDWLEHDERP